MVFGVVSGRAVPPSSVAVGVIIVVIVVVTVVC